MNQLHRDQDQAIRQGESHPAHLGRCSMVLEVFRQVDGPHRAILNLKPRTLEDLVGGNSRCAQLGQDQHAVADDTMERGRIDPMYQLIGAKSSLTGSAPDVNPLGIQHHDIAVNSR